jgi:hypothetical protein
MKNKELKLCFLIIFSFGLTVLRAQEAIPAAGGNGTGSGGTVSYSVGQVVYTTNTGTGGSVSQGVQQPFEISIVTEREEAKGITLYCSVYPNPSADFVMLKVDASATSSIRHMSYQLYDGNGKLLENKEISGIETSVDMSHLVKAPYFLKVIQSNKPLKTFKIIKN